MNTPLRKPMTEPEFLVWEDRQELRYEFDGVAPVAMTGGTAEHELIGIALRSLLRDRLSGTTCRVFGPTIKIAAAGSIRYPDAFVSCAPLTRGAKIIPDPVIVFEILSAGTSRIDRIVKLREYQATASIQRYVIVEQNSIAATVFTREAGVWTARPLIEGDVLEMPEIGIELSLAEIYVDVTLPILNDHEVEDAEEA
jgi:Uma2 family endonuclease